MSPKIIMASVLCDLREINEQEGVGNASRQGVPDLCERSEKGKGMRTTAPVVGVTTPHPPLAATNLQQALAHSTKLFQVQII